MNSLRGFDSCCPRTINFAEAFEALLYEKDPVSILSVLEKIHTLMHDTDSLHTEGATYLLRFNQLSSEMISSLTLTPYGKQVLCGLLADCRHNMEWELRMGSESAGFGGVGQKISRVTQRYKGKFLLWWQGMNNKKDSD